MLCEKFCYIVSCGIAKISNFLKKCLDIKKIKVILQIYMYKKCINKSYLQIYMYKKCIKYINKSYLQIYMYKKCIKYINKSYLQMYMYVYVLL